MQSNDSLPDLQSNKSLPLNGSNVNLQQTPNSHNYQSTFQLILQTGLKHQAIVPQTQFQRIECKRFDINEEQILRMFKEDKNSDSQPVDETNLKRRASKKIKKSDNLAKSSSKALQNTPNFNTLNLDIKNKPNNTQDNDYRKIMIDQILAARLSQSSTAIVVNLTNNFIRLYRQSIYASSWQVNRYKYQLQFFVQLCIGVEELRAKPFSQLLMIEQQSLNKIKEYGQRRSNTSLDFGVWKYVRNLVIMIDTNMFLYFHKKKVPLSHLYQSKWCSLNTNISDPTNHQLRAKILTRSLKPADIKTTSEFQFLPSAKQAEIKLQQKKLLAQFSAEGNKQAAENDTLQHAQNSNFRNIGLHPVESQNSLNLGSMQSLKDISNEVSTKEIGSKYLEQGTFNYLEELLGLGHIKKMNNRIQEDIKGQIKERILSKIKAFSKKQQ